MATATETLERIAIRSRVLRATDDEFRTWSRRVLAAASFDAVFAE